MLVLTRKSKERIFIKIPPSDTETLVEVQLNSISNNTDKIGIEAPAEVGILRDDAKTRKGTLWTCDK